MLKPSSLLTFAFRGALTGLALAFAVAGSLTVFSQPPTEIEANAFAAFIDGPTDPNLAVPPRAEELIALHR